jgi:NADH:ubiquinone oxidoreductase subunit 4 (subunit M)
MNIFYVILLNSFIYITNKFNSNNLEYQFRFDSYLLPINFNIGIDGINLILILLVLIILPIVNIIRDFYNNEDLRFKYLIMILGIILILFFLSNNILLFYIMFELILIPMFLLILIYGSRYNKIEACYKLFIYTLIGSLFFLLSIIIIYIKYGTTYNELIELKSINEDYINLIIL